MTVITPDPWYPYMSGFGWALRWSPIQRQGALSTYGLWVSQGGLCGCGGTGSTFWPTGRNDGENCLAQNKASWTFCIPHSVCRPHRWQTSGLSDSNSCEREGSNSVVHVNCEEEWWCYSMFHDCVPREITGLDQWKCLVGEGEGHWWWRGKCRSHLGEWWCFNPMVHGSQPSRWVWNNWWLLTPRQLE